MTNGKPFDRRLSSFLTILIILFLASFSQAQEKPCTLKLSDLPSAPELMGFRMGMTMDQVRTRVPQVVFPKSDVFGLSKTSINPYFDPRIDKTSFAGIRTISLDFLDGRLTSLWLGFDSSYKWNTVPDFVKGISQALQLPETWSTWKIRGEQLHCADFQMSVIPVADGPSFRIMDETADATLTARREAEEEKAVRETGDDGEKPVEILADKKGKIYYPHGCHPDKEISPADRLVFSTIEEAKQAGYKLGKNCSP